MQPDPVKIHLLRQMEESAAFVSQKRRSSPSQVAPSFTGASVMNTQYTALKFLKSIRQHFFFSCFLLCTPSWLSLNLTTAKKTKQNSVTDVENISMWNFAL